MQAIASAGIASRRNADDLILAGKVKVNGEVVSEPGVKVNMAKDKVRDLSTGARVRTHPAAASKNSVAT
jgi:23S rRNA pseudouridine2605 synthase